MSMIVSQNKFTDRIITGNYSLFISMTGTLYYRYPQKLKILYSISVALAGVWQPESPESKIWEGAGG
jgi:hypothetical protein